MLPNTVALLKQTGSATIHLPKLVSMKTRSEHHLQYPTCIEKVVGFIKDVTESYAVIGKDLFISL